MHVETVTTSDSSLLRRVRGVVASADSVLMCVAFAQERGVHLLRAELEELRARTRTVPVPGRKQPSARIVVTTTFGSTSSAALAKAQELGVEVRMLNPGSGVSFHPKIYLGRRADEREAVIGSANLTGGLATNLEAGVWLQGTRADPQLERAWSWGEDLWSRAERWEVPGVAEGGHEEFAPDLLGPLAAAVQRDPVFWTLGSTPARNLVTDVSPAGLNVETGRSVARTGLPAFIPAFMFNLAWDYLRLHGQLSNAVLLKELRVHRSSAVCAILARLPGIERAPGEVGLRWRPGQVTSSQ